MKWEERPDRELGDLISVEQEPAGMPDAIDLDRMADDGCPNFPPETDSST